MRLLALTSMLASLLIPAAQAEADTRTLHAGPGHTYATPCAALTAAHDGDTVLIDARGRYRGDACAFDADHLTIRGVHGRPRVEAAGAAAEGKAIWVVKGEDTTIADVELSGAEVYVDHVRSLVFRYSLSTRARVGHLLKSRAQRTVVKYSALIGGRSSKGTGSYELDLPNGGDVTVVGTAIQQSSATQNSAMVAFGEEGGLIDGSRLRLVNVTLVNDLRRGTAVYAPTGPVLLQNVISVDSTDLAVVTSLWIRHVCPTKHPRFVDRAHGDYRLRKGSPCRHDASKPGNPSLVPRWQFVSPAKHVRRYDEGRIAGAFGKVRR